ncbi:MAG TPA: energy-coupling factor transporter ATPase [Desulfobacteria bacterium]|nr:energy-coupling factor transporter ATPase [Desulfobacteria bacterium]
MSGETVLKNLIEVCNLDFSYHNRVSENRVLKNINLNIQKGEFITVLGPNGCGKSTLVRHFNALLLPKTGSVKVNGLSTTDESSLSTIRRTVGMVFQNPDTQLFASVVEEDVAFGVENMCLPRAEIKNRVEKVLDCMGLSEYRHHPPHRLSGGQRQKTAIAGILAMEPECIVLDEPTSMLDPKSRAEVLKAVRELNIDHGIAVIYVTHDMAEALYFDRLIALNSGEVVFDGLPQNFFYKPENAARAGIIIPPIIELVQRLSVQGITLSRNIKSPEELVDALCRLNSKM